MSIRPFRICPLIIVQRGPNESLQALLHSSTLVHFGLLTRHLPSPTNTVMDPEKLRGPLLLISTTPRLNFQVALGWLIENIEGFTLCVHFYTRRV